MFSLALEAFKNFNYVTNILGGLARLDIISGPQDSKWENYPVTLTVFSSDALPLNVIPTPDVNEHFKEALANDELIVPSKENTDLPELKGQVFEVFGASLLESSCDIVLSSVGWVSVTARVTLAYEIKAWTPAGKGLYLRDPPFLPYAVNLKGKKIRHSPYFGESSVFIP